MKIRCVSLFVLLFVSVQMHGMTFGPKFTGLPLEIIHEIFKCTDETRTFCALRKTCKANRDYLEKFSNEVFFEWYTSSINDKEEKKAPLVFGLKKGHSYAVKRMLKSKNIDINKAGSDGMTPLCWAVVRDNSEIVKMLLDYKADVNIPDKNGETPLHRAARNGRTKIVKALLKQKVDINSVDGWDKTPLHRAVEKGHIEIVSMLLAHKADINKADWFGKIPLYWARYFERTEILKLLKEHGAKE